MRTPGTSSSATRRRLRLRPLIFAISRPAHPCERTERLALRKHTLQPLHGFEVVVAEAEAARSRHCREPRAGRETPGSPGTRIPFGEAADERGDVLHRHPPWNQGASGKPIVANSALGGTVRPPDVGGPCAARRRPDAAGMHNAQCTMRNAHCTRQPMMGSWAVWKRARPGQAAFQVGRGRPRILGRRASTPAAPFARRMSVGLVLRAVGRVRREGTMPNAQCTRRRGS